MVEHLTLKKLQEFEPTIDAIEGRLKARGDDATEEDLKQAHADTKKACRSFIINMDDMRAQFVELISPDPDKLAKNIEAMKKAVRGMNESIESALAAVERFMVSVAQFVASGFKTVYSCLEKFARRMRNAFGSFLFKTILPC